MDARASQRRSACSGERCKHFAAGDRKSTRLNSSHLVISYAVFCLKKKNKSNIQYNSVMAYSKSVAGSVPGTCISVAKMPVVGCSYALADSSLSHHFVPPDMIRAHL